MAKRVSWYGNPLVWLELFVLINLSFLALDVFVAHSYNDFAHPAEWIPFYFSLVAPIVLVGVMAGSGLLAPRGMARWSGLLVGWGSLLVGIGGMFLHLESRFFEERTLRNLVYTAPFAAPLAYSGLGFLLLLDRMVDARSVQWARWVVLFALGGFVGNFTLSLADHAQNGFFDPREWIPVGASAFAIGFLAVALILHDNRQFLSMCLYVMIVQVAVGLLGAYYHLVADLHGPMPSLWENVVYGAPIFAPLLFPNLAMLAGIGLVALRSRTASD